MSVSDHSYVALRVVPLAQADAWWSAARRSRAVPPAIKALLKGRTRIEVDVEEAAATLAWAATLDGWETADPKPLVAYPHDCVA